MPRRALRAALSATALSLALSVPALAQGAGGSDDCPLLSSDEVAAVLGGPAPAPMVLGDSCTWITGTGAVVIGVTPGFGLDAQRATYPGGVDKTVAGFDAYYTPTANQIFVDLDGQQLFVSFAGAVSGDMEAVLTGLAESAAARVPAREVPAEGSLASMFPSEIGGEPVIVDQMPADEVAAMMGADPTVLERVEAALTDMGKTMADLEVAFGTAKGGQLIAYRVAGADAAVLLPLFVDAFLVGNPTGETSVQPIAGKDVTVASNGGQTIANLYASGDIVWTVIAIEPGLTEILTALP